MGVNVVLPECERYANCEVERYLFGFSPSTNKFKVLRILYKWSMARCLEKCEIVTVGVDDLWRRLPDTSFTGFVSYTKCVVFNGAFHWIRDDGTGLISTFEIADESYGQISAPPSLLTSSVHKKLVVFGDQLGIADSSALSGISIWKMRKYGVVESWMKVVVLTIWPPLELGSMHPVPVAELPNGDVLVSCSSGCLLSYSIKHKEWSEIRVSGLRSLPSCDILNYTPNFSSPSELIAKGYRNASNASQSSSQ